MEISKTAGCTELSRCAGEKELLMKTDADMLPNVYTEFTKWDFNNTGNNTISGMEIYTQIEVRKENILYRRFRNNFSKTNKNVSPSFLSIAIDIHTQFSQ